MRINIDLPDDVAKWFNVQAAQSNTKRKNYIEALLIDHSKKPNKKSKP